MTKTKDVAPGDVRVVDLALEGQLLPAAPGTCPECATAHEPQLPHNQQSLFWHYKFYQRSGGRWPTWDDAMAHCTPAVREQWRSAMKEVMKRSRGGP